MSDIRLVNFVEMSYDEKIMVLEWRNHEGIKKWMYTQNNIMLEEHLRFIETLKNSKDKLYFLVYQNNEAIGVVDFYNFINSNSSEFGLYSNPNTKIAGVGRVLERVSLDYAFDVLKVDKLKLEVFSDNVQVKNLHKKFNFIEVERKIINDREVVCMELICENR